MQLSLRVTMVIFAAFASFTAWAGPAEDANAVIDRWSAAYSANDADALVALYAPDAVLFGTVSPIMSEGSEAIRTYFGRLKGSGNQNTIKERRVFVLDDNAVGSPASMTSRTRSRLPPSGRPASRCW